MNIIQREKIIIYLKNMKHERHIRKYGHIVYSNPKEQYVSMYVSQDRVDEVVTKLMKLKYVTRVVGSPYKYLKREYSKEVNE
ncbi:YlbG family protein [Staphylococcus schleiferi]|uniref:YlbG family protein n=1 Tax=Staphylococcus schleiferi TaxID=1295 RepID=UPI00247FBB17|nr:YlbG family protein [Staphylococcus schleiferi]